MDLGDLLKDLVWDNLVKAALEKLFAAIPILGWGPIGWIVSFFVMRFAEELYRGMKLAIDLEAIALKNEAHRKAFENATLKLQLVAREKGIDSPEFKAEREARKKALSDFVSIGPKLLR